MSEQTDRLRMAIHAHLGNLPEELEYLISELADDQAKAECQHDPPCGSCQACALATARARPTPEQIDTAYQQGHATGLNRGLKERFEKLEEELVAMTECAKRAEVGAEAERNSKFLHLRNWRTAISQRNTAQAEATALRGETLHAIQAGAIFWHLVTKLKMPHFEAYCWVFRHGIIDGITSRLAVCAVREGFAKALESAQSATEEDSG